MEYLNEEIGTINRDIAIDTTTVLRSWEGVRVADAKVRESIESRDGRQRHSSRASLRKIQEKWAVEH